MAYCGFKKLPRKTASDKVLSDNALNIAKNLNYDDTKAVLPQWFKSFLIKCLLLTQEQG